MQVHEITALAGARKRRKRRGRGESSGLGKTSGRGHKGVQARSGGGVRPLSEGGAFPLFRRVPKRGFNNYHFRTEYDVVNLASLNSAFSDGQTVDRAGLRGQGLIGGGDAPIKILAKGTLERKLTVEVHAVSASAREQIEKAGGSIKLIERRDPRTLAKAKRGSAKNRKREKSAKRPRPTRRKADSNAAG
jgi:large subunit ribosomal protein L15